MLNNILYRRILISLSIVLDMFLEVESKLVYQYIKVSIFVFGFYLYFLIFEYELFIGFNILEIGI